MTIIESKALKTGNRVCWGGNASDCGQITETNWSSVTIAWDNNHIAVVHHGDMREIHRAK